MAFEDLNSSHGIEQIIEIWWLKQEASKETTAPRLIKPGLRLNQGKIQNDIEMMLKVLMC